MEASKKCLALSYPQTYSTMSLYDANPFGSDGEVLVIWHFLA
jgi:hypothetical protein